MAIFCCGETEMAKLNSKIRNPVKTVDMTEHMTEQQIPKLAGLLVEHQKHFTALSNEDGQWVILNTAQAIGLFVEAVKDRAERQVGEPKILRLNQSVVFKPEEFIGKGWKTWKGPANGDGLTGEEAIDKRSLSLTEIDFSKVLLETCLKEKEINIKGEEKLKRLTGSDNIQFAGNVFLGLWQDWKQHGGNSVLEWLRKNRVTYLDFFGQILRVPGGCRDVLCLCWHGVGWGWGCRWLGDDWFADDRSAGLAS